MPPAPADTPPSLDAQLRAFLQNRFMAMPLTGMLVWFVIGLCGWFLPERYAVIALFAGTGMIFYLALGMARLLGEDLLGRSRKGNYFDRVFLAAVMMAVCVYAIAIPWFLMDHSSLPLSVGILTGLMWIPFSALLRHGIGYFHGLARTALVLAAWYVFPEHRFVVIPAVIIAVYAVTLVVLQQRWNRLQTAS